MFTQINFCFITILLFCNRDPKPSLKNSNKKNSNLKTNMSVCVLPSKQRIPAALYNFSYYPLFPPPYCQGCQEFRNDKLQCKSAKPYDDKLNHLATATSGRCPYGHFELEGACVSALAGNYVCESGMVAVNGQCVQTGFARSTMAGTYGP